MSQRSRGRRPLLRGAKAIANYVFGDESLAWKVPALSSELGLIWLDGMHHANPDTIDARLSALEAPEGKCSNDTAMLRAVTANDSKSSGNG